jgi:xanthine dehydrogenase accessory factor
MNRRCWSRSPSSKARARAKPARPWPSRAASQFDTIGGGHLELRACEIARAMLDDATPAMERLQRFPLGPALGQCCGGVTHLAFERIADRTHLRKPCGAAASRAGQLCG